MPEHFENVFMRASEESLGVLVVVLAAAGTACPDDGHESVEYPGLQVNK